MGIEVALVDDIRLIRRIPAGALKAMVDINTTACTYDRPLILAEGIFYFGNILYWTRRFYSSNVTCSLVERICCLAQVSV